MFSPQKFSLILCALLLLVFGASACRQDSVSPSSETGTPAPSSEKTESMQPNESTVPGKDVVPTIAGSGQSDNRQSGQMGHADRLIQEEYQPLAEVMQTKELEALSSHLSAKEDKGKIRPLFAYDKERLILQRLHEKTGYIAELLLYEEGKPDLLSIFTPENEMDSIHPMAPSPDDVQNEQLRFSVMKTDGAEDMYQYDLKTASLIALESPSEPSQDSAEKNYVAEQDSANTDYPWLVKGKANNTLFHVSSAPLLSEGKEVLILQIRQSFFLWDGAKLYEFPESLEGKQLLEIQVTSDDTIYAFVGEAVGVGQSPRLGTERVLIVKLP